jgi:hypothetical protein
MIGTDGWPDDSAANWLPNLERPTRSEPKVPAFIYTHGPGGNTNKDIMNSEAVFCDVAGLLTGARP